MQYTIPQAHQRHAHIRNPNQHCEYYYPPTTTTNYYAPINQGYPSAYYPSGSSSNYSYYNPFPGHIYNSGGNRYDGHGIQRNGDVKIGNTHDGKLSNGNGKRKNRKTTIIGGCHGNQGGHQVSGDIILGDIH